MSGFRPEDDDDLSSLLQSNSALPTMSSSSYFAPTPSDDPMEEANPFASNPFADMQSSAIYAAQPPHAAPQSPPARADSPPPPAPLSPVRIDNSFGGEEDSGGFAPVEDYAPAVAEPQSPFGGGGFEDSYAAPIAHAEEEQTPFYVPPSPPLPSSLYASHDEPSASGFGSPTSGGFGDSLPTSAYIAPPPTQHTRQATTPQDLADLLGEEQPILPSFKKKMANEPTFRRDMMEQMAMEDKEARLAAAAAKGDGTKSDAKVLPESSLGSKKVGGHLAALLGLEPDEKELKREEERKVREAEKRKRIEEKQAKIKEEQEKKRKEQEEVEAKKKAELDTKRKEDEEKRAKDEADKAAATAAAAASAKPEPTPTTPTDSSEATPAVEVTPTPTPATLPPGSTETEDEQTPISTPAATTPTIADAPAGPIIPSALATPLPPSPSASPAPQADDGSATPALSRTSSLAPSLAASDAASDSGGSGAYDNVVSPMENGTGEGWPGHGELTTTATGLEGRLNDLHVASTTASESAHSGPDPFASFYQSPDEPRRQVVLGADDALPSGSTPTSAGFLNDTDEDSLRGTYSRSLSFAGSEETETDRTQAERALPTSPPLPPLPTLSSTAGSPPRSAELGGSLGPSFVISVGDPQKVGNALNVAAQHTVYTVHTRTSHPAFRKKDFSVLRRFSHFLWLFDALTQNNPGVIVPGMPEKSAIGRFGSEFVENRRLGLETALMRIVQHPMLVGDPDLRLFLESDSFSVEIKQRKIEASSESKGFLGSLGLGPFSSGPTFVEFDEYFDTRRASLETFERELKALLVTLHAASAARVLLQNGLADFETALANLAHCEVSDSLRGALEGAAVLQKRVRLLGEQQTRAEEGLGGLTSVAEGYARLCVSAKLVFGARIKAFHAWQAAEEKLKKARAQHDKAKRAGRDMLGLSISEIAEDGSLRIVFGNQAERRQLDAKSDFEDVSKLTKAEMARFDKEKVDDFKKAIEEWAEGMAKRQREVVNLWQGYHDLLTRAVGANPGSAPGTEEGTQATSA